MKLIDVLNGESVWPPPVWLMRQAGRYLPEYREVRAQAGDFLKLCMNPELAAEVTLQPIRRYGFDAAILFSDILILPWALGQNLKFSEGEGPVMPAIRSLAELETLSIEAGAAGTASIFETVRRVRDQLSPQTALIGFAGGPFTVACYMLDGKGGGEFPRTRMLAYENPALVEAVIELLVEATIAYLLGQVAAGADCVMLFESWAGILPPAQFKKYVIAPNARIVTALKQKHPGLRIIGTAKEKAGVLSFVLDGYRTEEVGGALNKEGIAVRSGHHCAQPALRRFGQETSVRPSLALYNNYEDIDAMIAAQRRLR